MSQLGQLLELFGTGKISNGKTINFADMDAELIQELRICGKVLLQGWSYTGLELDRRVTHCSETS